MRSFTRTGVWFTEKMNLLFGGRSGWFCQLRRCLAEKIRSVPDLGGFGFTAYNNVDSHLEAWLGFKVRENIRSEAG